MVQHVGAQRKKRALPELDSGKIELKAEFKSSLNSFLRCRTKDGDGYLQYHEFMNMLQSTKSSLLSKAFAQHEA